MASWFYSGLNGALTDELSQIFGSAVTLKQCEA
jgi:hypothetical protein